MVNIQIVIYSAQWKGNPAKEVENVFGKPFRRPALLGALWHIVVSFGPFKKAANNPAYIAGYSSRAHFSKLFSAVYGVSFLDLL